MTDNRYLPAAPPKWICVECLKLSYEKLEAVNPFDASDNIVGCPKCRQVNTLRTACHYPGCEHQASGGYPEAIGYAYAWLCLHHAPKKYHPVHNVRTSND